MGGPGPCGISKSPPIPLLFEMDNFFSLKAVNKSQRWYLPRDMRIRCLEPGSYLAKSTKRAGEENEACLGPRRKTSEELAAKQIHRM